MCVVIRECESADVVIDGRLHLLTFTLVDLDAMTLVGVDASGAPGPSWPGRPWIVTGYCRMLVEEVVGVEDVLE